MCRDPAAAAADGGVAVSRQLRGRAQLGLPLLGGEEAVERQRHGDDADMETPHAGIAATVRHRG